MILNFLLKLFNLIIKHKIISGLIILFIFLFGIWGYGKLFNKKEVIRYITTQIQKETFIQDVSGNGQISVSNQIDIKPKTNGEITAVYIKAGQEVREGTVLAIINPQDAERLVRDAETALEIAKIELDKLLKPTDDLTLLQAENNLIQAQEIKEKNRDNLNKAYEDGFNTISNAFLDLPAIMSGLENILLDKSINPSEENVNWYLNQTNYQTDEREKAYKYRDDAINNYNRARIAYTKNFDSYKTASRNSNKEIIEALIEETYNTTKLIAEATKAVDNYIDFVQDAMESRNATIPEAVKIQQSNISNYTNKSNNHLLNLLSIKRTIQDYKEALVNSERSIKEKELYLEKIKKEPDELDIRIKKIAIQQKENALINARQNLADHYVRAPFAGTVAKINTKKGDMVSSSTPIITLITKQKIAEVSLSEIDIVKVKNGQKAKITFDAIPDLEITGQVLEVDTIGTISQGVVNYYVKIGFDLDDIRIKPGMSITASIITEEKSDVILVPNSAIKSQNNINYVEMPDISEIKNISKSNSKEVILKKPLRLQKIEVSLNNDEFTEVVSGLSVGDIIITRKIQSDLNQKQNQSNQNSLRIPGFPSGGRR
jgi:HlyD family secretion protein